jgi:hypothetical protein
LSLRAGDAGDRRFLMTDHPVLEWQIVRLTGAPVGDKRAIRRNSRWAGPIARSSPHTSRRTTRPIWGIALVSDHPPLGAANDGARPN